MLTRFFQEREPLLSNQQSMDLTYVNGTENKASDFKAEPIILSYFGKIPSALTTQILMFLYDYEIALLSAGGNIYIYQQCSNFLDNISKKFIHGGVLERRPTEYTRIFLIRNKKSLSQIQCDQNTIYLALLDSNNPSPKLRIYWYVKDKGLFYKTVSFELFHDIQVLSFPKLEEEPFIISRHNNYQLVDQIALRCDCSKNPSWKKSRQEQHLQAIVYNKLGTTKTQKYLRYTITLSFLVVIAGLCVGSYFILPEENKDTFLKAALSALCVVTAITGCGMRKFRFFDQQESALNIQWVQKNALAFYNRMERRF